jgi:hypothetical protein
MWFFPMSDANMRERPPALALLRRDRQPRPPDVIGADVVDHRELVPVTKIVRVIT